MPPPATGTGKNNPGVYIVFGLLSGIFILEYILSPRLIPRYTAIQDFRLVLTAAAAAVFLLRFIGKEGLKIIAGYLFLFMLSRLYEVLFVLPRIHTPHFLLSLFIFSNLLAVFILIFYTCFKLPVPAAGIFFLFSIVYEFLYFHKLKDLPPILIFLVLFSTLSAAIIARLLKMELEKKNLIRGLYEEEKNLKHRIALIKGRMLEQEKSFSLSMLSAGIAHELGNPVNYLQGNLYYLEKYLDNLRDMMDRERLDEGKRKVFETVIADYPSLIAHSKTGFERITGIISNMKELYGNRQTGREKVNLRELLTRTVEFFKISHTKIPFRLETDLSRDLYVFIHAEEYYIVFTNLLSNALESILLSGREGCIRISTLVLQNRIVIEVSDNGTGISADEKKLFDPFFSTKNSQYNLGLGLALCREIITSDNGTIGIENNPELGACVKIQLSEYRDET